MEISASQVKELREKTGVGMMQCKKALEQAGLALEGWEVKSLREGRAQLTESYVTIKNGEAFLVGAHFSPLLSASSHVQPDPTRSRKLLLHRGELDRLIGAVERKGYALVPLDLHWHKGRAKLAIGLGKGKWLLRDPALSVWYEYAGWANLYAPHRMHLRFGKAKTEKGKDILLDPEADFSTLKPAQVSTIHALMNSKNAGVYELVAFRHGQSVVSSIEIEPETDESGGIR